MHIFTTKYGKHLDLDIMRRYLNAACATGKADLATLQFAREIVETLQTCSEAKSQATKAQNVLNSLKWLVKMLEDDPDGAPLRELYSAHIEQARAAIEAEGEKPEFPYGEFDNGKHWNSEAEEPYIPRHWPED